MAGRSYKLVKQATATGPGLEVDIGNTSDKHSIGIEITDPNSSYSALSIAFEKKFDNGTLWHTLYTHVFSAAELASKELVVNFIDMPATVIRPNITVLTGGDASSSIDINYERGAR